MSIWQLLKETRPNLIKGPAFYAMFTTGYFIQHCFKTNLVIAFFVVRVPYPQLPYSLYPIPLP